MGRFWWLFFFAWPVVAVAWTWVSPDYGWWFNSPALSSLGKEIDDLFYMLMIIVTVVFLGTQVALVYVVWKFTDRKNPKSWFLHGSHTLEVLWTIAPAGILLFIALYQMDVWQRYRMISKFNTNAMSHPLAEVTARQFEWRIRHPSPDRHFHNQAEVDDWLARPKPDDLYTVNDLHMPSGKPVVIHLRTEDVLHSFFIPDLRVKQDAVPGMVIPVWFDSVRSGHFDLVCAELCGWGHYKMRGRITSESEEEFKQHLAHLKASQNFDGVVAKTDGNSKTEDEGK
ncbi:MAG: cytochrome c oxidase subunit II [Planctomycetales bacterium]